MSSEWIGVGLDMSTGLMRDRVTGPGSRISLTGWNSLIDRCTLRIVYVAPRLVSLGAAVLLTAGLAQSATAAVHFRSDRLARPHGQAPPVSQLLVQFSHDTSSARLKQIVQRAGGKLGQRLRLVRAAAVGRRSGVSLEELRARLRSSDRVLRVEDDSSFSIAKSPDDPGLKEQYAIKQKADHDIDAPSA
jgi:hypothetical protein